MGPSAKWTCGALLGDKVSLPSHGSALLTSSGWATPREWKSPLSGYLPATGVDRRAPLSHLANVLWSGQPRQGWVLPCQASDAAEQTACRTPAMPMPASRPPLKGNPVRKWASPTDSPANTVLLPCAEGSSGRGQGWGEGGQVGPRAPGSREL